MVIKKCMIFLILIIVGLLLFFPSINAEENIYLNIHMLGENARTSYGNKAIVAGIWHYINLTFENLAFQELILRFFQGNSIPAIALRDETNYYEWKYNKNTQLWTDAKEYGGYSYINESNCKKTSDTYSFCVGVKDTFPDINAYHENWTLEIYKDGIKLHIEIVTVEKPIIGIAKSHDDTISYNIDPFSETVFKNEKEYFIIKNTGNVPLDIFFNYGVYNDIIEITNFGKILSPNDSYNYYVTLYSGSWKPGILQIQGLTSASILNDLIITTAAITFNTNVTTISANLKISIGHSNYTIQEIMGTHIVFQYEEELYMNEGQIRDITVYVSGEGKADLDISSDEENIKILKITSADQKGTPLTINSKNTSEYAITIRVEALRENKVGIITYKLAVDGKTETYHTSISIGPPLQQETVDEINIPSTAIFVGLCFIFVIGYMISNQIRHKRR